MLARYFNWKIPIDDALAISFIVFVLLQPGAVYQVGFQLSYLATVSLIYSGPILANGYETGGCKVIFNDICLSTLSVSAFTAIIFMKLVCRHF